MAKKKKKKLRKARVVLFSVLMLVIVALVATVIVLAVGMNKKTETASTEQETTLASEQTTTASSGGLSLTYEGGVVAADGDTLQKAVDEMYSQAAEGYVAIEFQGSASSADGKNFSCYIANAKENKYDMFIALYEDSSLTKQIYLSGLIPTGSAMERFVSDYELSAGEHTCTLVMTQVESDHATMHAQVQYSLTLIVNK